MASKPVVAQTKDGAEYGFPSETAAKRALGENVKIVRNQDGTAYEPEAKPAAKKAEQ